MSDMPLLTRSNMIVNESENGGIIVVGSHTAKTTSPVRSVSRNCGHRFYRTRCKSSVTARFANEVEADA